MSGWIPADVDLPNHPKSIRLGTLLGDPRAWTHVIELWMWAFKYASHGNLHGYAPGEVSRAMGYPDGPPSGADVIEAMKTCGVNGGPGFLDQEGRIHDWHKHVGRKLKARERARRWKEERNRVRTGTHSGKRKVRTGTGSPDLTVPDLTVVDQKQGCAPATVPEQIPKDHPEKCPDCERILSEFNRLSGRRYTGAGRALGFIHSRHRQYGTETCLRVAGARIEECLRRQETWKWANPETIFRPANFERAMNEDLLPELGEDATGRALRELKEELDADQD